MRRSAISAASQRAENVSRQLSDIYGVAERQLIDQARALAGDSEISVFLHTRDTVRVRVALARLATIPAARNSLAALEVWDASGRRLLTTNDSIPPISANDAAVLLRLAAKGDAPIVGPFSATNAELGFPVVATVRASPASMGFLVQRRRIVASPQTGKQLQGLIGTGAALLVGNTQGDVWTSLGRLTTPPPIRAIGVGQTVRYERPRGHPVLASVNGIRNTPWSLAVEFPLEMTLGPARALLWRLAFFTMALLLLAAIGAWALSGTLTDPIATLVAAAEGMSAGDHKQRVSLSRRDEIGVLGAAFNEMAERVARSRDTLERTIDELEDSEARYHVLFESSPQPTWVYDVETKAFLAVNSAAVQRYRYSGNEFLDMTILDIRPREDVPGVLKALADVATDERPVSRVSRHRTREGTLIDVETHSRALLFAGRPARVVIVNDLSERRRAEESLRAAQQRLERVIGSSGAVLYELRLSASGPVLDWISHNVVTILGYELADAYGSDWWSENVHPHDRERFGNKLDPASFQDRAVEYRFRNKAGQYRWVRDEQRLVPGAGEQPTKVVGALVDVTDQRMLADRLRQSQKMEAMGALAGGVAHDFNNMLTVVGGYSQLLLASVPDDSPLREDIDEILKATTRAAGLTQQLLAFSRGRVIEPQLVDLGAIVRETKPMLGRLVREDIDLVVRLDSEPVTVVADPNQLTQVLMNLVVNARDAMPDGGLLSIETGLATLTESSAQHHATRPGPHAVLTVTDSGIGMDAATQSRIFEPFFTTKPEGRGTGLGLSTVFGIIKQLGGSIWVYSEPQRGTTFKIYLPQAAGAAHRSASERTTPSAPRASYATVLLVEDDAVVRRVTRTILERAGHVVLDAVNGVDALAIIHEAGVDVVVTDTVMAEMGGRELAGRLAVERPEIPVILTSGYTADTLQRQGPMPDLLLFVEKPYTAESLEAAVQEALRRATRGSRALASRLPHADRGD